MAVSLKRLRKAFKIRAFLGLQKLSTGGGIDTTNFLC